MPDLDEKQLAIETTIMALREVLMDYFKGNVQRVTDWGGISVQLPVRNQERYSFLRRQVEEENEQLLCLREIPLLTMQHCPDTVTFHTGVLKRSKEFRAVHAALDTFLSEYLPAVERKENPHAVYL